MNIEYMYWNTKHWFIVTGPHNYRVIHQRCITKLQQIQKQYIFYVYWQSSLILFKKCKIIDCCKFVIRQSLLLLPWFKYNLLSCCTLIITNKTFKNRWQYCQDKDSRASIYRQDWHSCKTKSILTSDPYKLCQWWMEIKSFITNIKYADGCMRDSGLLLWTMKYIMIIICKMVYCYDKMVFLDDSITDHARGKNKIVIIQSTSVSKKTTLFNIIRSAYATCSTASLTTPWGFISSRWKFACFASTNVTTPSSLTSLKIVSSA